MTAQEITSCICMTVGYTSEEIFFPNGWVVLLKRIDTPLAVAHGDTQPDTLHALG